MEAVGTATLLLVYNVCGALIHWQVTRIKRRLVVFIPYGLVLVGIGVGLPLAVLFAAYIVFTGGHLMWVIWHVCGYCRREVQKRL